MELTTDYILLDMKTQVSNLNRIQTVKFCLLLYTLIRSWEQMNKLLLEDVVLVNTVTLFLLFFCFLYQYLNLSLFLCQCKAGFFQLDWSLFSLMFLLWFSILNSQKHHRWSLTDAQNNAYLLCLYRTCIDQDWFSSSLNFESFWLIRNLK